jgi:hypothetical protein
MNRKLNTTLGFYSPSFLRMHVGTNLSLMNLNAINDDFTESVFLHEYIHFIQDLTTTYGLSNICITIDYLKYVNNYLIKLPKGNFIVPILPKPNHTDNVHANFELSNIYIGSGNDDEVILTGHQKINTAVTTNSGTKTVPYIQVDYKTNSGQIGVFEFGALCIVENMAFIIECECYANCEPSPDLPYYSAEKLVQLIFPVFGADRLNILALCDASLKTFHPGQFFYDTLIDIRDKKIPITNPEDVYEYCNSIIINFNGIRDFNFLLEKMRTEAISQINGYFNDTQFQPIKQWLEKLINSAVDYRLANDTFLLDIARQGKFSTNKELINFLSKVGTPLVTNDIPETTLFDPHIGATTPNYATIWAIDQIHAVLWGWQRNCDLLDYCNSSGIMTDRRCTVEPWERHLETTCAFGQIWRHWGLTGYKPQ